MPYQGVALFFMLGVGIATAALIYLFREQEGRQEQPYGYGGGGGYGDDDNLRNRRRRRQSRQDASSQICTICQDDMNPGGLQNKMLPCGHQFHSKCVEDWGRYKRECPQCRRTF